jgi:hypothetical protein
VGSVFSTLPNSVRLYECAGSGSNGKTPISHGVGYRSYKAEQRKLFFVLALQLQWGMDKPLNSGMTDGSTVRALRILHLHYID